MRRLVDEAGLTGKITIDSAGTGNWHAGELPDARTRAAAARRGYELTHRARQFGAADFDAFDLVLAMDRDNLATLERISRGRTYPTIRLLRSFDPESPADAEVPDPYSGMGEDFEQVLDLCERACRGLLDHVRSRLW